MKLRIQAMSPDWDNVPELRRYAITLTVSEHDLDELEHVNNTVYLTWCEQVARRHAESAGLGTPALVQLGAVPVALEHVIRYAKPGLLGDLVRVRTALTYSEGVRSTRAYTIDRINPADPPAGVRLAECQTQWAWVDPTTGRPKRTPQAVLQGFGFPQS